jgi:aspartyl-tRNA(Asn)/glutamyl-tRNA(Gln) amidotransferase subunit A
MKGVDQDVLALFDTKLDALRAKGHTIVDIELPRFTYALACYYIIMPAEASSNLARFDGMRYGLHVDGEDLQGDYVATRGAGFGPEVRRRIILGTYVLSHGYYDAYYEKANDVRWSMVADVERAFREVDIIATPTTPTPAFRLGEKSDPLSMYLTDIFTVPANLTGCPALSIPMGDVLREGTKLPTGFQVMAPRHGEAALFHLGKECEA